jgi:hypothetical protein
MHELKSIDEVLFITYESASQKCLRAQQKHHYCGLSKNITIVARELEELPLLFRARFGSGALSCAHLHLKLCP